MNKKIILIAILALAFILPYTYADLSFSGRGCQGNSVCDTSTACDLMGNCNTDYSNCVSCGTKTGSCPAGMGYCEKTCEQVGSAADCKDCQVDCSAHQIQMSDPYTVLKFNVFTKKNFIKSIDPTTQTGLAGKVLNYKVTIANDHPKTMALKLGVNVPKGWSSEVTQDLSMAANSNRDITFKVTSNESESDGTFPISFVAYCQELGIFDKIDAKYVVASRGPPTVSISPNTQEGVPGQELSYTVTITNTDPSDFDPSTIYLTAAAPAGWKGELDKNSIKLDAGQTGTVVLSVTSSSSATEISNTFSVNATANKLSAVAFSEYKVSFCGDGVCQPDENCEKDCLQETNFICDGRCEQEVDDGVRFSSTVSFMFNKFIICPRNSTIQTCEAAYDKNNCGYGKPCLCGSGSQSQCLTLCVDKAGSYYLYAKGDETARSLSNYSFTCPFVDLPEIIQTKANFTNAQTNYEKARSAYKEIMDANETQRPILMPCYNVLDIIVRNITAHVSYLDEVINTPAKSNTTIARERTDNLRALIESLYGKYCRGAAGILTIDSMTIPSSTERDANVSAKVVVKNTGNTKYYGHLECDFIPPAGDAITVKESCTEMNPGFTGTFNVKSDVTIDGDWTLRCSLYGSLEQSCEGVLHDQRDSTFNVYSKDAYVVDVSGNCEGNTLICSVRLNKNASCASCKIGNDECTFISRDGPVSNFSCHINGFGAYNITGYATQSSVCNPVSPSSKNVTARCSGCGDSVIDKPEQCELPNTLGNKNCPQTEFTCEGKKYNYRNKYGFCAPTCQCSPDEYTSSCTKGKCGAVCSDGETKNETITTPNGRCTCVQHCTSDCELPDCTCEPINGTGSGVELLDIGVSSNCPTEKGSIDVTCLSSVPNVDCIKAKVGSTICEMNNNSYWYGNSVVFAGCPVGSDTNSVCGNNSREVKCYIDKTTCIQVGDDKTIGIDVMPANTTPQDNKCTVKIDTMNCTFNPLTNLYDINVNATWSKGDHAHIQIDDQSESQKKTTSPMSFMDQTGTPGLKTVKAYVHDSSHNVLCYDNSEIYCGTESTTGEMFDVIREMQDKTPTGDVLVKLMVIPYVSLSGLKVTENVEKSIVVTNRTTSGNTTTVLMTGPSTIIDNFKNYSAYSWTMDLAKGMNVTISYIAGIDTEGTYRFFYKGSYKDVLKNDEKLLLVSNCKQTETVWAKNVMSGSCQRFNTACDVPSSNWEIQTNGCNLTITEPVTTQGFDWTIPLIIIVVIIVVFLYVKREWVKEKWEGLKDKIEEWRYGKEQM